MDRGVPGRQKVFERRLFVLGEHFQAPAIEVAFLIVGFAQNDG